MTTNIILVNKGPKPVKVEIKGRDQNGRFMAEDEFIIPAGGFKETYLTDSRSIQAFEEDAPAGVAV